MPTIDGAKVQKLLNVDSDVSMFIESAQLIVSEDLANKGLSDQRLAEIGVYLAAHFGQLALYGGQIRSTSVDGATDKWAGEFKQGFTLTAFGQQAMQLDTSKTLVSLAKLSLKPILRVM